MMVAMQFSQMTWIPAWFRQLVLFLQKLHKLKIKSGILRRRTQ